MRKKWSTEWLDTWHTLLQNQVVCRIIICRRENCMDIHAVVATVAPYGNADVLFALTVDKQLSQKSRSGWGDSIVRHANANSFVQHLAILDMKRKSPANWQEPVPVVVMLHDGQFTTYRELPASHSCILPFWGMLLEFIHQELKTDVRGGMQRFFDILEIRLRALMLQQLERTMDESMGISCGLLPR